MPDIDLKKENIPFWAGGDGVLRVHLAVADPLKMLPADTGDLLSVGFNAGGTQPFSIGGTDNVKLGIDAETSASLAPYWSTSGDRLKVLADYGLLNYFDGGHADRLLLALALGGKASADLSSKFKYSALTADASLKAGADAAYVLVRSFPADKPAGELIADFFKGLRLPSDVDGPLADDEVIIFEYGGYLNFAASVGAGYEISGSKGIDLRKDKAKDGDNVDVAGLEFVEKYGFSLMAKLGFAAGVAGRFRIEVRPGSADGWARVVVRKSRNKMFSIAADVEAGATLESDGLPNDTADEFVSALVGVKSKNWLNLFNQVKDLTDFDKLQAYVDKLAQSFIEEYTGKAFDKLDDNAEFTQALALIRKAAQQYMDAGDRAVTLFDKYFDAATGALDAKLTEALDFIKQAQSWADIKDKINDKVGDSRLSDALWAAIGQLTDGDQLGWMLGKVNVGDKIVDSLEALKERADKVIALARSGANDEIRRLIALAKSKFPYDKLVNELAGLDAAKLKAITDKRLEGFVERIVGNSIDKLKDSEVGAAVTKFNRVLVAVDGFKEKLFAKGGLVEQALNSSYKFKLHAEYKRTSEDKALLDVEFDLGQEGGRALMRKAGMGDFLGVIEGYDAGFVKLNEGALTHTATRETSLAVNITGWHLNWNYQSLDRIITSTAQNFVPGPKGTLNVLTTVELTKEKEVKKRDRERTYTNMMLRFVGESHGTLEKNEAGNAFLVNSLTGMESSYELSITRSKTKRRELEQALSFADDFRITATDKDAVDAVAPYLDEDGGNVGDTSVTYNAAFTEDGLRSLFTKQFSPVDERFLRETARRIVLTNYMRKGADFPLWGWCYWSENFYKAWKQNAQTFENSSNVTQDSQPMGNLKPPSAQLTLPRGHGGTRIVSTLYKIEESLIKGMRALSILVRSGEKLDPREFEDRLADFGKALAMYDKFDEGDNTVFAMFDALIQHNAAGQPYRESSLEVKINKNGKETTKVLVA
jgi:hypothetical protein